jgi:hypothetical protein
MFAAPALLESLTIASADVVFDSFSVTRIWQDNRTANTLVPELIT